MQNSATPKLPRNSFLISVLLHLLLLLSITIVVNLSPEKEQQKPVQYYTPAYMYHGAMTPSVQSQSSQPKKQTQSNTEEDHPQHAEKFIPAKQKSIFSKSVLSMSENVLKNDQMNAALNSTKNQEPILLIGDSHSPVDPLIKSLGRSLSAHFNYPKIEGNLGERGRVIVEMILHPEGNFTEVRIVSSSDNQDFDAAALYAVNTAPKVIGANKYLSEPKYFMVGFIFN